MFAKLKHQLIKNIEKIPLLQIFIYNNLQFFKFLFPHDKDYYALRILFSQNEKRAFLDVGGNIGLSSIGFRKLGFKNNIIHLFEPDKDLIVDLQYTVEVFKEEFSEINSIDTTELHVGYSPLFHDVIIEGCKALQLTGS